MKYTKGMSGNPAGRPPGPTMSLEIRRILGDDGFRELVDGVIAKAKEGDMAAAGLILARVAPPLKPQSNPITLPVPLDGDVSDKAKALFDAVADGSVSPSDGREVLTILSGVAQIETLKRIEERLTDLESRIGGN